MILVNSRFLKNGYRGIIPTVAIMTLFLATLTLTGCEDVHMPHLLADHEVPDEVVNAPRVVGAPVSAGGTERKWSRLGDVPVKPKDFSAERVSDSTEQLKRERAEAFRLRRDHNAAEQVPLPANLVPPQFKN